MKKIETTETVSLQEAAKFIVEHADEIYVSEQVNGEWGEYPLAQLPARLALKHGFRLFLKGIIALR